MLDASAAKAELEEKGDSKDANVRQMLIEGKRKKKSHGKKRCAKQRRKVIALA
jgi:hypothetical protein